MNILYIHQYFKTPEEPGGTRSYWISQELLKRGHHVTMICSTNERHPEATRLNANGIDVIYVKNEYSNYMPAYKKVWSFISFIASAIRVAKKEKNVDLVFATSTPLTVGYVAMRLKKIKKWPYVFEVRDLWPEFPIQIGAIKNKFVIKYLRGLERRIYKNSEFVIALSPGMQDGVVAAGMPKEKTAMIPNMSKPDKFFPHEPNQEIVEDFDLDLSKFNVVHFGSMGRANGLEYIVEAAKVLQDRGIEDVCFWFMGRGATEPVCKRLVEQYGLNNVRFLGFHKMSIVSEIVNCSSASITTFRNLPILATNSPNKLFDSLSAGKPIIVNSAGWTKTMVEEGDCGFYVDPDNPIALADKIIEVKDNKESLQRWGKNARELSLKVYDKDLLTAQVADVLEKVYNTRANV